MGKRFQEFVGKLAGCADEREMIARVDEEASRARTLGKQKRVKRLAAIKGFLHTGMLPHPGAGAARGAVLQLAQSMIARGMIQPDYMREPLATKGADASGRRRFALVVEVLKQRAGDDLTDTGALLNAVDAQLAAARQEGRHKLAVKLLALKSFLAGKKLEKTASGGSHIRSLAVELVSKGLLAPDRIPCDAPRLPDPLAPTVKALKNAEARHA